MNKRINIIAIVTIILILTGFLFAQKERGDWADRPHRGMFNKEKPSKLMIPDLTDVQKEQIEKLRTEHMKNMLPIRNEMGELRAELRTLSTAEKANMNKINQKIEEIGKVKTEMIKERAAHCQSVRSLLTEEQRVKFDAHPRRMGMGKHRGRR